jgi:phage terminase Nu1 subunit (DNA packaging protein)
MAALYADEDFPQPVVAQLRAFGHDVLTAGDDGRAGQGISDVDVLARATALGRAVLTHNRADFRKLHAADPGHAGIVTATRDADVAALAGRIDAAVRGLPAIAGQLVRVVRPNAP